MPRISHSSSKQNHIVFPLDANLSNLFQQFLQDKFQQGLAATSIDKYTDTARALDFLTKSDFDRRDFIAWVSSSAGAKNWARSTLVNHLRRLCAFNRWLFYQSACLRLHRAPRMSNRPCWREMPTAEEWANLFEALKIRYLEASPGRRKSRWRDYLIARVLFDTGMRISEVSELRVGDFVIHDPQTFWLFVGGSKSEDAERACLIDEKLTEELRAYLWTFRVQNKAARIFTTQTKKAFDTGEFCKFIKPFAAGLGIAADVTPHVFRHYFILQFIANGGSALELQARLGHADIKMTVYYFNQVRRLLPFVKANADISILERKQSARARFFQRRNFTEDK